MLGGEAKEQVHQAPAERRVTSIAVREASKAKQEKKGMKRPAL